MLSWRGSLTEQELPLPRSDASSNTAKSTASCLGGAYYLSLSWMLFYAESMFSLSVGAFWPALCGIGIHQGAQHVPTRHNSSGCERTGSQPGRCHSRCVPAIPCWPEQPGGHIAPLHTWNTQQQGTNAVPPMGNPAPQRDLLHRRIWNAWYKFNILKVTILKHFISRILGCLCNSFLTCK